MIWEGVFFAPFFLLDAVYVLPSNRLCITRCFLLLDLSDENCILIYRRAGSRVWSPSSSFIHRFSKAFGDLRSSNARRGAGWTQVPTLWWDGHRSESIFRNFNSGDAQGQDSVRMASRLESYDTISPWLNYRAAVLWFDLLVGTFCDYHLDTRSPNYFLLVGISASLLWAGNPPIGSTWIVGCTRTGWKIPWHTQTALRQNLISRHRFLDYGCCQWNISLR